MDVYLPWPAVPSTSGKKLAVADIEGSVAIAAVVPPRAPRSLVVEAVKADIIRTLTTRTGILAEALEGEI